MTWTAIADTCSFAKSYHSTPGITLTRFTNIDPPVLAQKSPNIFAFRATIQNGVGVTLSSNQGIWGNGGPLSQGLPTTLTPWLIAREGDPVPASPAGSMGLIGNSNAFTVKALQVNAVGQTYATVNIDAPGTGSAYLMDNCCLQTLAASGPGAPFVYSNLQSVVTSSFGNQVAGWARDFTPRSGTMEWLPTAGMLPCATVPFGNISWQATPSGPGGGVGLYRPIPTRVGSPAISERGIVAHHAVDSILPIVHRPHIRVDRNTGSVGVVVRTGWATGGGDFFGNFHTNLLAVCDSPAPMAHTVAWQMQDLRATPTGPPITGSNSLWAKCATGPFHRIAQVGLPALDVPAGNFYGSFHALHVVGPATTTGDSLVIFGVRLMGVNAGKTVIYSAPITAGGTVLGTYTRIATDVPGACAVNPILTGADTIANLFPFFSTNTEGDVLIKATLFSAPAANRQVLISARAAAGHPLTVRSQSGMPITPGMCTTAATITNFTIANPEQGTYSRGQAISSMQGIGARVNFTGGHGAFIGF